VDINTILANIRSQALVGNTGASDDMDRLMRYINKAYVNIYSRIGQAWPEYYEEYITIPTVNGKAVLDYFTISEVYDNANNLKLRPRPEKSEDYVYSSTLLSGQENEYQLRPNGIWTYVVNNKAPTGNTTLGVTYIPNANVLVENSVSTDILIPAAYHEAIEWMALWTLAYDERDKMVGTELQFTQQMRDEWMNKLLQFIHAQKPQRDRTVRSY